MFKSASMADSVGSECAGGSANPLLCAGEDQQAASGSAAGPTGRAASGQAGPGGLGAGAAGPSEPLPHMSRSEVSLFLCARVCCADAIRFLA